MPPVLTNRAQIQCPHGGLGVLFPMQRKLWVQGASVLQEGDTFALTCVNIVPCVGFTLRAMGFTNSTIDGRRVILSTDFQQSQTGMPLTIVESNPLADDSTPAPLPAGQAAPPIAPELLDLSAPSVSVAPATGLFNATTMVPAGLAFTFSLRAAFPGDWSLRLLNSSAFSSVDLTNGGAATVVPSGGVWSAPSQQVTVTWTAAALAALGVGTHELYLTAVSRRGVSAFAKAQIVVS